MTGNNNGKCRLTSGLKIDNLKSANNNLIGEM